MQVSIHYLFSNNHKLGSKLISWGTKHLHPEIKDVPSHGAILINERWVVESTLETGVRVIAYKKWKIINNEIAKIPSKISWKYSEIKTMYKEISKKDYDWLGVIYQALCIIPNKLYGKNIPKENKWQTANKYFCLEVIGKMNGCNYEMTTPIQLMEELRSLLEGK